MNVLIVAERQGGALRKATLNALSAGRLLAAKTGGELHVALLGHRLGGLVEELRAFGGKTLHVVDAPPLEHALAEPYAEAVATLAKGAGATWIGGAATAFGKDLLPRVAARLGAGMASDVLRFEGEGEAIHPVRPMWAGDVVAEVEIVTALKVFTLRATEFPAANKAEAPAEVRAVQVELSGRPRTRFLESRPVKNARPELTEARVVVAGGRGMKGNFEPLERLADELGAAVGASRVAVDNGWIANDFQVGQTGKIVAPDLYIAAGISGAVQHVAGMKGSRVIVAINNNPDAPIFQYADYGLVGDASKVLPELREAIKASK
ncbi:MAG TPA: electron transfer flavoprotein subunit alpha [Myxococcales bacterium]|nr:electron transfer flavoprotein subunit alpha [Myxococcales bacterium]